MKEYKSAKKALINYLQNIKYIAHSKDIKKFGDSRSVILDQYETKILNLFDDMFDRTESFKDLEWIKDKFEVNQGSKNTSWFDQFDSEFCKLYHIDSYDFIDKENKIKRRFQGVFYYKNSIIDAPLDMLKTSKGFMTTSYGKTITGKAANLWTIYF